MYTPQGFRGIFTMMIPCGNMDRSTHPALHFTGTVINQIHNLFYHLFTCPAYFFLFNYYIVGGLVARICASAFIICVFVCINVMGSEEWKNTPGLRQSGPCYHSCSAARSWFQILQKRGGCIYLPALRCRVW